MMHLRSFGKNLSGTVNHEHGGCTSKRLLDPAKIGGSFRLRHNMFNQVP